MWSMVTALDSADAEPGPQPHLARSPTWPALPPSVPVSHLSNSISPPASSQGPAFPWSPPDPTGQLALGSLLTVGGTRTMRWPAAGRECMEKHGGPLYEDQRTRQGRRASALAKRISVL